MFGYICFTDQNIEHFFTDVNAAGYYEDKLYANSVTGWHEPVVCRRCRQSSALYEQAPAE